MIETYGGTVYPHQLDHMGHMNVQWYTAKFDEATWHLFAQIGITPSYIAQHNMGMAALEQTTHYLAEAMAGDLLLIESTVIDIKNKTIRFFHTMSNAENNKHLATSEIVAAHLNREIRKSAPLPESIRRRCETFIRDNPIPATNK